MLSVLAAISLLAAAPVPGVDGAGGKAARAVDVGKAGMAETRPHPGIAAAREWLGTQRHYLHAMLVEQCGKLIDEQYFGLYDADQTHDLQSATKTFTGSLIGIALREGLIKSLDQPLAELLPKYRPLLTGEKAKLTLRHVLTMSTGLRWVDHGPRNSFDRQAEAEDSVAFILGEPQITKSGESWFYNTGSSHLLSAIVQQVSGMTAREYAEAKLFGPLGITSFEWRVHPDGVTQGGWLLYLRPRDMLKLGRLYLDGGVWNGARILPAEFVQAATTRQFEAKLGVGYGFQTWVDPTLGTPRVSAAMGWGGQMIYTVHDAGAVVVFTGDIHHTVEAVADIKMLMTKWIVPDLLAAKDGC